MDEILDLNLGNDNNNLPIASKGQRFTNYIIDMICYLLLSMVGGLLYYILIDVGGGNLAEEESNTLLDYLIGSVAVILYYTTLETLLRGKTIGKYFTKTRVLTLENEPIDFSTALIRSFSRIVPFEAFSFLGDSGYGWHDKWSDTKVVSEKG